MIARYLRGTISTELGDFERAFLDFQRIIKDTSTDDNNFKGQQTWIDKKIDIQNVGAYTLTRIYGLPDGDAAKLKQAYCQILTSEFDKSITAIDQISNPKKEPLATYLKAVAYEHKGDHNTAFQYYDLTLRLDPEIADAHKKMGIYYQELKQWDKSVESLSRVLKIYPDNFVIAKIRGTSYYYLQRYPEAIADFTTYLAHDTTNIEVMGYRGMAYFKNGQRLKAYLDFANSDNENAINFPDLTHLVDSVIAKSDTTKTMALLSSITKGCPFFTEGFVRMYKIQVRRNEWKEIEQTINRAVRSSRMDATKTDQAYLLTLQGMNFARLHHEQDAIDILTEAVKLDSKSDLAYLERGKILLAQGKTSKAESDFRQASALGNQEASQLLASGVKK
jgi:tetratricopeptide (TPR) repeat protein